MKSSWTRLGEGEEDEEDDEEEDDIASPYCSTVFDTMGLFNNKL